MPNFFVRMYAALLCFALMQAGNANADDLPTNPIVKNNSFEAPSVSGYEYRPTSPYWNFSGNSGIQVNASVWGQPFTPHGYQSVFLQAQASISQAVNFPFSGNFNLKFYAANRASDSAPHIQKIAIRARAALIS